MSRFEHVFVEQGGASTKVDHKELASDIFMLKKTPPILAEQQCATYQQYPSTVFYAELIPEKKTLAA